MFCCQHDIPKLELAILQCLMHTMRIDYVLVGPMALQGMSKENGPEETMFMMRIFFDIKDPCSAWVIFRSVWP